MRRRFVSFYVEWTEEAETDAIRILLLQHGIRLIGIDEETDRQYKPGLLPRMIIPYSGLIWIGKCLSTSSCPPWQCIRPSILSVKMTGKPYRH